MNLEVLPPQQMGHSPPMLFWNSLSNDDKTAYLNLKESFHGGNGTIQKSRHQASFKKDLYTIHSYIERRTENIDIRSIVCGIHFSGKFVCVNTRQLKYLLGRCKSSINNGLQQLGYISAKNRVKQVIVSVLPSLLHEGTVLRQWTLRCAENDSIQLLTTTTNRINSIPKPPNKNLQKSHKCVSHIKI